MSTTFRPRRTWYHYPYMLPAEVLSDEPTHEGDTSSLRADASRQGFCFLKLLRTLEEGIYLARVAASVEALHQQGYTVLLYTHQLVQARPWHRSRSLSKSA